MDGEMDVSANAEAMALLDAVRRDANEGGPEALSPDVDELRDDGTSSPDDVASPAAQAEAQKQEEALAAEYIEIPGGEGEQPTKLPIAEAVEAVQRWNEVKDKAAQIYESVQTEAVTHARGWLEQQTQAARAFDAHWQAIMQVMQPPQKPSAAMIREHGYEVYAEAMEAFERQNDMWQRTMGAGQQMFQAVQVQQKALADRIDEMEAHRLLRVWPEMADPAKGETLRTELVSGLGKHYGLDEAELNAITNHKYFLVARDALAYRALQKGATPAPTPKPQETKPAPKLVRTQTQAASAQERGSGGKFVSSAASRLASEKSDAAAVDFFKAQIRSGKIK